MSQVTGIILAGGQNLRMGRNKAFIEVGGQRIIDRTCALFQEIFDEIILVTNSPLEYLDLNLRTVTDLFPGKGSLGGIYTGLFYSSNPHSFFAGCDMPFLNGELIRHLIAIAPSHDLVIPRTEDGWQPLHAAYSRKCLPFIEDLFRRDNLKILDLFSKKLKKKEVPQDELLRFDPSLRSFFNVNSPEDLARMQEMLTDWE
jgi:molybdenum cofactor guanylyltransferase